MGRGDEERAQSTNVQDVDMYFNKLRRCNNEYRKLNAKLEAIKTDKRKVLEKMDLINERKQLRETWLAEKKSAKSNIKMLMNGMDALKETELREIQEDFREIDAEFKAMGVMVERDSLFDGAARDKEGRGDKFDPKRASNDDLLDKALAQEGDTLAKLKQGLATVETTKEVGRSTAAQLQQDTEKIKRIDAGLDEAQSELSMSTTLISRFAKRMATDKIIIAFAFLLVVGLVGIITYASLNPDQDFFNVPDTVKPQFSAAADAIDDAIGGDGGGQGEGEARRLRYQSSDAGISRASSGAAAGEQFSSSLAQYLYSSATPSAAPEPAAATRTAQPGVGR